MKFSIRDLFLVTVIVALALGWWIDHRQLRQDREIWEYHARGVVKIAPMGVKDVSFNGRQATAKHPHGNGTFTRTWPEETWRHDDPTALPIAGAGDFSDLPLKHPAK
jgi:hypothetical protein